MSSRSLVLGVGIAAALIVFQSACTSNGGSTTPGQGGSVAGNSGRGGDGGAGTATGGAASGGTTGSAGSGGTAGVSAGGTSSGSAGTTATGGIVGTGGRTTGSGGTGPGDAAIDGRGTDGASTGIDGAVTSKDSGPDALAGNVYNPQFKEFYGEDCTVAAPKDVNISTLPDLFVGADGSTRMSKKSDWRCQRAYLKQVVEKYIHGAKPGRPEKVTGTVSKTSIAVHVENGGKSIDFSVPISIPGGATGPVPIIIGLGAVASGTGTASLAKTVSAEGVATGTYDHQGMLSESSRTGLFTKLYGSTNVSSQIGWAWGVSRVIDVLVDEKAAGRNNIVDPTAVGVFGCSRNGKGAFTVGAFDERIALGIPQESGTAGVSAVRMLSTAPKGPNGQKAEQLSAAKSVGPAWFGTVFDSYSIKLDSIPGDMHSLVAMFAPRGLIVLDNSRIGELCSTCQHAASAAGQQLYQALGLPKNMAYHAGLPNDPQQHCSFNTEQVEPLQRAIRAHLTKKAAPDGRIELQKDGVADLKQWITWTAPALTDDISWASPPLTSQ